MKTSRLLTITWPAFLAAGMLTMLVFAMVDPHDLHWFGHPLALSRAGVYTLAFFARRLPSLYFHVVFFLKKLYEIEFVNN